MKKFLLLSCAFAACVGASAQQQLQKAPVAAQQLKVSGLTATKFDGTVARKAPKKVSTANFIGLFVNNEWNEEQQCNTSTVDTMFTANVTTDDGEQLNVAWGVYANLMGSVYAKFDETTNTFTAPAWQYFGNGAPVQITDEETSPVVFAGVSTNRYYCDFVAQYDPATGILTPNDTIMGYIAIIAEGSHKDYYITRNFAPFIARANAVEAGFVSGESGWDEITDWPVYMDFTTLEDGVVDVYNHYTNGVAGCKFSMDVDGSDVTMATGQPISYITDAQARQLYGDYVLLRGVAIHDDNTISTDMNMATIEGGTFDASTNTIAYPKVYYRGFSEVNQGRGWGTPFFAGHSFTPLATGINSVTTKAEKATDNRIFNLAGQQVDKNYKGVVIQNGVKKLQK